MTMKHGMKWKRKFNNALFEKLDFESAPEI